MAWAPVIGLVLGAIAAAVLYVFGHLLHTGSLVAAVLAVGSLAVLSRGLHLDGLAALVGGHGDDDSKHDHAERGRRREQGAPQPSRFGGLRPGRCR